MKKNNFKLIGKSQEDLKVISAYSQDSIITVKDMIFLEKIMRYYFFFAGASIITLISESIEVVMNDLGESWNVKYISKHKI